MSILEIVYHGLGYVGLTGAVHFAQAGVKVIGYDPDPVIVKAINGGLQPSDTRPELLAFLRYLGPGWRFQGAGPPRATTNFDEIADKPIHIIAVPTERNGEPYDEIVLGSIRKILGCLVDNGIIIVESTLQPGTIDKIKGDLLSSHHLAVCPRRDWFADPKRNLSNLPRVIGGVRPCCTQAASAILSHVTPVERMGTDYRTAEVTKALENALFHLPIMLCHQLACAMPNVNIAEAVRLASTHWRFESFGGLYLGMGPGGRCVPLGPRYLLDAGIPDALGTEYQMVIARSAILAESQLRVCIARAARAHLGHNADAQAFVLGVAYRPGFKDAGSSPGLAVARALRDEGLFPTLHDPMWEREPGELAVLATPLAVLGDPRSLTEALADRDVVLLATPHKEYLDLPERVAWRPGQVVIDGQGAWKKHRELFAEKGVKYVVVGEPGWTGP